MEDIRDAGESNNVTNHVQGQYYRIITPYRVHATGGRVVEQFAMTLAGQANSASSLVIGAIQG